MNHKNLWILSAVGVVVCFIFSILLHFLFSKTGLIIFAVLAPVNESVWEHLKLLTTPFFIYYFVQLPFYKTCKKNFTVSSIISLFAGPALVLIADNTIKSINGKNHIIFDISITVISFILMFSLQYFVNRKYKFKKLRYFVIIFVVFICMIVIFTFNPPRYDLFMDKTTETYGITSYYVKEVINILKQLS